MRSHFQALPGIAGRARPVVDLVVDGLELAPQACLLDTGASDVHMGMHVADLAGIELAPSPGVEVALGGLRTTGKPVRTQLEMRHGSSPHAWTSTVYFCDPWPWAFGLLGLAGMDTFLTIIDTYEEWVEIQPLDR